MSEVIICDTNVVIQLTIICHEVFGLQSPVIKLVIHSSVKSEIHQLRSSEEKLARLEKIFDFISKQIPTTNTHQLPNPHKEESLHRRIQTIESGLPPEQRSAGSSRSDRRFLILAKTHNAKLLTNEKTLFGLSSALLGSDRAWRTSDCLCYLLDNSLLFKEQVQKGIEALKTYKESLSGPCAQKMRERGFLC